MNIEFKGTPGEWHVDKRAYACAVSDSGVVANCGNRTSPDWEKLHTESVANALLISKAPEMLAMLKRCNDWIANCNDNATILKEIETLLKQATEL